MQLSEQGRLDLNDKVSKHLDFSLANSFPEPVRIKHLMAHTAGFEELNTGTFARTALEITPLGEYLSTSIPAIVRPPGQQTAYSNYGAALAGYIIERVTGQPWSDYVDQNVLQPLGMNATNTHHNLNADFAERHAKSYSYHAGAFEAMGYQFFIWPRRAL
jgi:CubicO group peptidase (beta-lactamase class C family)